MQDHDGWASNHVVDPGLIETSKGQIGFCKLQSFLTLQKYLLISMLGGFSFLGDS